MTATKQARKDTKSPRLILMRQKIDMNDRERRIARARADADREREAMSVAPTALAPRLPRSQRSMANYARLLVPHAASS
jgi:hypothetical protein